MVLRPRLADLERHELADVAQRRLAPHSPDPGAVIAHRPVAAAAMARLATPPLAVMLRTPARQPLHEWRKSPTATIA